MADEITVIPKAGSLIINSGNIVNWNRLKRKPTQNPTEEISECISSTFQSFLAEANKTELHQVSTDAIKEAVERALTELDVTFIESVLLAFPEVENEELSLETIQPYWKALEALVYREMVLSIGMADLDKNLLEQVYDWAEIKPVVNQVNLDSCCVMPKDLIEYAKLNDIQLLTHNDPRNILPSETLQEVLREIGTEKDGQGWEPSWVLRYSVLVKCRGIVKSKGYLLKAERDIKKRK